MYNKNLPLQTILAADIIIAVNSITNGIPDILKQIGWHRLIIDEGKLVIIIVIIGEILPNYYHYCIINWYYY